MHGGNELEASNCNQHHNEPPKRTCFSTEICSGTMISAATAVVERLRLMICK
jgi:hypothetical protein